MLTSSLATFLSPTLHHTIHPSAFCSPQQFINGGMLNMRQVLQATKLEEVYSTNLLHHY